ncbi:glutathione transport system permease protein GsiC (plasmid) [Arthrobacter sp. Hiyo8]|nr:glutathione transport system permease protein GsiC [Arthrobacter sp. Hiyo8]
MANSTQLVPVLRRRAQSPQRRGRWRKWVPTASRIISAMAVIFFLGMLPWMSNRDPAVSIFQARYPDANITPTALDGIRQELGLGAGRSGVLHLVREGAHGRLGCVLGQPAACAAADAGRPGCIPFAHGLLPRRGHGAHRGPEHPDLPQGLAGRTDRPGGGLAAAFTSMPEFLLASLLLVVFAVWLRWFPPYGWANLSNVVLPALSMGLPAGGYMGRLFSDAVATTFSEHWVATWSVAGFSKKRMVTAVIRRSLPGITPQIGLVFVAVTAAAVSVELVFSIPGIGSATLNAAQAQDLPMLQAG